MKGCNLEKAYPLSPESNLLALILNFDSEIRRKG